jgi:hypothetical protein
MKNDDENTKTGSDCSGATCSASWPRPWRKWHGNYQKCFYDLQTTWGKTIIGCWPGAGKMSAADGTGRSWKPHQVAMIRRSIKEIPEQNV